MGMDNMVQALQRRKNLAEQVQVYWMIQSEP